MEKLVRILCQEAERVSSDLQQIFPRLFLSPFKTALSKLTPEERRKLRISPDPGYIPTGEISMIPTGEISMEKLYELARKQQAEMDRYCPHLYEHDE